MTTDFGELALTARNASVEDLVALLRGQQERKVDVVAPASSIRADDGCLVLDDTVPVLTENGVTMTSGRYRTTGAGRGRPVVPRPLPARQRRGTRGRAGVADSEVGARLRGDVGHERMRSAWAARRGRLPRDQGHLAMMDASKSYLRQFVPDVLAAVRFDGGPGTSDLLRAAGILAGLYASKARKVPDGAPDSFVPARWAGYLETASKTGDVTGFRHYWELCVLPMAQAFGTGTLSSSDGQKFPVKGSR